MDNQCITRFHLEKLFVCQRPLHGIEYALHIYKALVAYFMRSIKNNQNKNCINCAKYHSTLRYRNV